MTPSQSDLTLRDVLRIVRRRRAVSVAIVAACVVNAAAFALFTPRRYTSSGVIELQKSAGGSLGLSNMMNGAAEDVGNPLSVNLDVMTEANILQSDTLAMKVIGDLHLDRNSDFKPNHFGSNGAADSRERHRLLRIFKKNLKVKPIPGTRLIDIEYRNRDPKIAADVVNDLVRQLIDYTFQVRFKATTDASKWLEVQLADLRNQTTNLQAKVVAMQKETGLFGLGATDAEGRAVIYSPVLERLQQATVELSRAQSNVILKGAVARAAREGNAELISELSGTGIADATGTGVANSFSLIQNLRAQEANLQAQIREQAVKFGPAYPKLVELRASLAKIEESLQDEIARVNARANNDLNIAESARASAEKVYREAQAAAETLNDKAIEFAIAQREANQSESLYQDLLRRLKEAGVIEGLHSSNITIVDAATASASPSEPDVRADLGVGLVLGLVLGACGAFLAEAIDNRVRGTSEVEALGYPILGVIPKLSKEEVLAGVPALKLPHSTYAEAIRAVRSSVLLSRSASPPQIVMVTSASPAEGKTTLALNLAIAFGQQRKKVLLIETDMRRPTLKRILKLPTSTGLSQYLSQEELEFDGQTPPEAEGLTVLMAGPIPPYPAELLGSDYFKDFLNRSRDEFDFIILDTPPVLPVADSRLIATYADIVLLVARAGVTTRGSLHRAYSLISGYSRESNTAPVGVILNAIAPSSGAYYEYYGYSRGYAYYGSGEQK